MWVCKKHIKEGLSVLDVPHIKTAPTGMCCHFCNEKAEVKMFYSHQLSYVNKFTELRLDEEA